MPMRKTESGRKVPFFLDPGASLQAASRGYVYITCVSHAFELREPVFLLIVKTNAPSIAR